MEKKSRRWLTITVLAITSLVFIGLSIYPMIEALMNQQKATPTASNPTAPPTADSAETVQKEEEGYQLVLKRDPNNQSALQGFVETRLKLIRLGLRKPKDVIEPLEKLTKLNPSQTIYATLLAQAYQQAGDSNAATQTYRNTLTQQPTNVDALQGYVALLIQQKKSSEALDLLKNTMATAKQMNQQQAGSVDTPALELLMGDVYLSQQRSSEAMILYNRLQKENPNDFRPVAAKGIVLRNEGKTEEAIALFKSAEALAPVQVKEKIQQLIAQTQAAPVSPDVSASPAPQKSP
ncbi:MAG: tetratricopeptide repeat protein [Acaryochloridaceae cyanobacterium RU_4_10]|nr:tetratricopeptide repeat protein [Acaryochloridaceae cyanobacterium RU_4_10]